MIESWCWPQAVSADWAGWSTLLFSVLSIQQQFMELSAQLFSSITVVGPGPVVDAGLWSGLALNRFLASATRIGFLRLFWQYRHIDGARADAYRHPAGCRLASGGVWCFSPWPGVAHWCCWADRWHGWRWSALRDGVVSLLPLMLFPESFLNGVIVTVLVGFRPQWIWSFRDEE